MAAAMFALATAKADTTYTLGISNLGSGFAGPFGTVTVHWVNLTTATVTFTGETTADSTGFQYLFGDTFINANATNASISNITSTNAFGTSTPTLTAQPFNSPPPGYAADGFGKFNLEVKAVPDGSSAGMASETFTLTDLSGTWADSSQVLIANSNGAVVADHTLTFQNGTPTNTTGFASNTGSHVPDGGSTVMLLGTVMAALGAARRFIKI